MSEQSVAYEALNLARQTAREIEKHEDICAERYGQIHKAIDSMQAVTSKSVDEIKSTMKWAGITAFGIIMGMLSFLLQQQLATNNKIRDQSAVEIQQLKQQLIESQRNRVIQVNPSEQQP